MQKSEGSFIILAQRTRIFLPRYAEFKISKKNSNACYFRNSSICKGALLLYLLVNSGVFPTENMLYYGDFGGLCGFYNLWALSICKLVFSATQQHSLWWKQLISRNDWIHFNFEVDTYHIWSKSFDKYIWRGCITACSFGHQSENMLPEKILTCKVSK